MKYLLPLLILGFSVNTSAQKSPNSDNLFRVHYANNGKKQDLGTDFKISLYQKDRFIGEVESFWMEVPNEKGDGKDVISSLVRLPKIALDPAQERVLILRIQSKQFDVSVDATELLYNDNVLDFYDCFGMNIERFTNRRKCEKSKSIGFHGFNREQCVSGKYPLFAVTLDWEEFGSGLRVVSFLVFRH